MKPVNEKIAEITEDIQRLVPKLNALQRRISSMEDTIVREELNADDSLLYDEYREIADKLYRITVRLDYLSRPIKCQGNLYKNSAGRYAIDEDTYFTSGSRIEVFIPSDYMPNGGAWILTSVEHGGPQNDYYLTRSSRIPMLGLMARLR